MKKNFILKKENLWILVSILIFISSFYLVIAQEEQSELEKDESELKIREKVQNLNYSGRKDVSSLLSILHTYPNLSSLDLSGSYVQNQDLAHIRNRRLSSLSLANTLITSDGIKYIGNLSQLRYLNMEGTLINDSSFVLIAKLHWLDRLDIGRTRVTDIGVKHLENSKISKLDLTSLKITDASMDVISTLENLQELYLWHTKITSTGLSKIQNLVKLRVLTLAGSDISDEGLSHISKWVNLKAINLSYTNISDEGLKYLVGNQSIEVLSLSGTKVSKKGLKSLAKMKKLKILTLEDVPLDSGFDLLTEIPHLKIVYLNKESINETSVHSLVKKMPWSAVYYNGVIKMDDE